jgi:hypothetical protein
VQEVVREAVPVVEEGDRHATTINIVAAQASSQTGPVSKTFTRAPV